MTEAICTAFARGHTPITEQGGAVAVAAATGN